MEACCDTISKICISIIQLVTEACCELKVKYIVMLKIKYTKVAFSAWRKYVV